MFFLFESFYNWLQVGGLETHQVSGYTEKFCSITHGKTCHSQFSLSNIIIRWRQLILSQYRGRSRTATYCGGQVEVQHGLVPHVQAAGGHGSVSHCSGGGKLGPHHVQFVSHIITTQS